MGSQQSASQSDTSRDHDATLKLLLERGADPNTGNIIGATPLHLASCIDGRPNMVRMLLHHGANVDAKNKYGQTALYDALQSNELECCELLLTAGADVDTQDAEGVTPQQLLVPPQAAALLQRWVRKRRGAPEPIFESKACDHCGERNRSLSLCARLPQRPLLLKGLPKCARRGNSHVFHDLTVGPQDLDGNNTSRTVNCSRRTPPPSRSNRSTCPQG